jgi:multiple sugar transport system substrate-binding protein
VKATAGRQLTQLFYQPVILPVQQRLEAMDAASIPMFDPSKAPTPSASPSAKPSN